MKVLQRTQRLSERIALQQAQAFSKEMNPAMRPSEEIQPGCQVRTGALKQKTVRVWGVVGKHWG